MCVCERGRKKKRERYININDRRYLLLVDDGILVRTERTVHDGILSESEGERLDEKRHVSEFGFLSNDLLRLLSQLN